MHQHSLFGEMSGETFSEHSRQQLRDGGGYTREVPGYQLVLVQVKCGSSQYSYSRAHARLGLSLLARHIAQHSTAQHRTNVVYA